MKRISSSRAKYAYLVGHEDDIVIELIFGDGRSHDFLIVDLSDEKARANSDGKIRILKFDSSQEYRNL